MSWFNNIRKYWRPVTLTIGSILSGVYVSAVLHSQPDVPVSNGPTLTPISSARYANVSDFTTRVSGYEITIKKGFVTDGASIPKAAWSALKLEPFSGTIIRGALVHDGLYSTHILSRQKADSILYAAILADKTEPHKAKAIYTAVQDCGSIAWDRATPESIAAACKLVIVRRL